MKLKLIFSLFLLALLAICFPVMAQAPTITYGPDSTVLLNFPSQIQVPDFRAAGWAQSDAFFTFSTALVTVILGFGAQLIPKWRKANLPMITKISAIAIVSVALLATIGGRDAWNEIVQLVLGSVLFQSHLLYSGFAKPLVGRTDDMLLTVANAAIMDPDVPTIVGPGAPVPEPTPNRV